MKRPATADWIPISMALVALGLLTFWLFSSPEAALTRRVPGADQPSIGGANGLVNPLLAGKLLQADGRPAELPGVWPRFRGPHSDGISPEGLSLTKDWTTARPRQLWAIDVGEGYAGPAIWHGRVYLMDYDRQHQQNALRCLSLADGREIWRYAYPGAIKRNHGMSRTVPAVTPEYVVAMDPKCRVLCVQAESGQFRWGIDLVRQYGAQVPPWYTGQCPLIDRDRAILAPGGRQALLLALDCGTGKVLWQTPNAPGWKMTHSSVMPMEFAGHRMYVYCASGGVVGISAQDGAVLWQTGDWKISIATVPSPTILPGGRIFLAGGYNAGSLMLQLKPEGERLVPQVLFRLKPEVFGATQHTPIFYQDYLYGIRPDGQFVCLDPSGRLIWSSGASQRFGMGSFLLVAGAFYALNDDGRLSLLEASPRGFHLEAQAQILTGHESWAPLALADGRLLARDSTRMVCLEVAAR
ncbi:MAG: PQQ-binding-like beta-propeller repeat protein [Verrucomicrobia bacterium]|nr:PQQ-binding-like beta-propeller repeat protein [Verrucomicrobiota bacterium]